MNPRTSDKLYKALEKIQYEPNFEMFNHKGYTCIVQRLIHPEMFMGNLNGYIFVPKGHKLYGRTDKEELDIEVHGGLTWSSEATKLFSKNPTVRDWWVFGFDTGHAFDMTPFLHICMMFMGDGARENTMKIADFSEYKDWEYVKQECKNAVDQIKERYE